MVASLVASNAQFEFRVPRFIIYYFGSGKAEEFYCREALTKYTRNINLEEETRKQNNGIDSCIPVKKIELTPAVVKNKYKQTVPYFSSVIILAGRENNNTLYEFLKESSSITTTFVLPAHHTSFGRWGGHTSVARTNWDDPNWPRPPRVRSQSEYARMDAGGGSWPASRPTTILRTPTRGRSRWIRPLYYYEYY